MTRIIGLISSAWVLGGIFAADIAFAREPLATFASKPMWSCNASLLPCRVRADAARNILPYWRGKAPERPIRANYTPAFPRTKR